MATHQRRVRSDGDGQVRAHEPDWTTSNDHDPGVTIVALFGFLAAGLLWGSSGRQHGASSTLYRVLGVGLGAAGVACLLRDRSRSKPPREQEPTA